jgi:di/tricarboxylate transporter
MDVPVMSLIALFIAIVISCTTSLNIGTLAIGLSLVVGYYFGGVKIPDIVRGYPTSLFIMLAGVTYLFAIAQVNGTLEKISKYAIKAVRGNVALLPVVLFFLAFALSAMGPGQITTSALLALPAMLLAEEVGISPLLMALVVGNGAQAGAMSPIAPPGIISASILEKMGITGVSIVLWMNMLITHVAVSILAYFLFGGWKLLRAKDSGQRATLKNLQVDPFTTPQIYTMLGVAVLIIGAVFFKLDIGMGAFMIGAVLSLMQVADEGKAIKAMPWGTILMVTGVTVLVQMMSKVGGMDLFRLLNV